LVSISIVKGCEDQKLRLTRKLLIIKIQSQSTLCYKKAKWT
jgi:hypothetical protein